ncbi:sodium:solute symporter [Eggerthellaceae bacterium zg-1084]|uniref:sodium:solute symporter family protein n=1 Tax=Berryella wangjianweii TaxID=2734634 RepID=UPI0015560C94|nr:sodium:solute symporter [Berryella wangjianweii]NPD30411.1 sodium:solute symporter [Berryella wangjianweii]
MIEKLIMLAVFFAVMIVAGVLTRRHARSVEGFVLGGRRVGPWLSAFAFGTSYFSAVIFVGYAGQFGWKFGLSAVWIGIGNAFLGSLLAWWVLGERTREVTRRLGASTMPEFFGKRFRSQGLRIASAAIIFVFLIPYTASVYNGLSRLFTMAFGVPYEVCVIAMALFTCVYVVLGGYMATVVNDFMQGVVMLAGIVAVVCAVLAQNGGLVEALGQMAAVSADGSAAPGALVSVLGPDPFALASVVLLTSLGTWGLPQMVQKFYAIESKRAIRKGAVISTVFALVVAGGSYFMGGFARLYADQVPFVAEGRPAFDAIVPAMLQGLPDLLVGLVVVLVLSASMSTLSSLVLTSSSVLTLDMLRQVGPLGRMSERATVATMRGLVAVFVAVSAAIALVQYHGSIAFIAQMMSVSWGALAGSFLGPLFWGLFSARVSKAAVWASFACGVGITLGNMAVPFLGSPITAGAAAMLASLAVVPLVSLVTKAVPFEVRPVRGPEAVDAAPCRQSGDGCA